MTTSRPRTPEPAPATVEERVADLAHLILDRLHFEPSTRDAEMDTVMDVLRDHLRTPVTAEQARAEIERRLGTEAARPDGLRRIAAFIAGAEWAAGVPVEGSKNE